MALSSDLISQFVQLVNTKKESKETTVYGTTRKIGDKTYVQLDGSELLTPVSTTAELNDNEKVTVLLKDHTATVTGNMSSPSVGKTTVKKLDNKITDVNILVANSASIDQLNAESARIDQLISDNALIRGELTANDATITNLTTDNVDIKKRLTAAEAEIANLDTTKIDAEIVTSTYATIKNLDATNAKVNNLDAAYGDFHDLTTERLDAAEADIDNLEANKLDASTAKITYATIEQLNATNADVNTLGADVAEIDTLIFGVASGDTIQTSFANAVIAQLGDAQIKSAMIESITADKITSGDVITNNVRVLSEDGKLLISDETIQISDDTRVRVQIGKDSTGDYSISIWDSDGNLMFSEGGITDNAIKNAIIRDDMVSDTADISAHKLNVDTLFEVINGSTNTIKSTQVYLDAEKQTLDVAFKSLSTEVTDLGETISSQGTQISAIQGQITSKIWQNDINTASNTMNAQHSELKQEVNSLSTTVASHNTQIANKADSSTVTNVESKVTEIESSLSGFQTSVSSTYATKSEVENIEIGGRNLLLNTREFKGSNISAGSASLSEETYKGLKVRTKDNTSVSDRYSDMVTFINVYADKLGEEYTLSYYAKGSGTLTTYFYGPEGYIRISKVLQSNGTVRAAADGASPVTLTDNWSRHWVTWTLANEGDLNISKWILFRLSAGGQADVCGVKLEKGTKATDWTPAPEDVDAGIANAQASADAAQEAANRNAADMATVITDLNRDIVNLQTQIDGSITTWFYGVEPTANNAPAVNWTTTDDKNVHLGDLYYDTITGYCYRYQVKNNVYSWQRITDTDVTKALSDARAAQDTADQKRRVFYSQPTPPYDAGDLWVQGSGGDILRCQSSKINGQSYALSDWVAASKYTDDTTANSALSKANSAQQTANTAVSDLANLKIGGRNLLVNSKGDDIEGWVYPNVTVVDDDVKGKCVRQVNVTPATENYIGSTRSKVVEPATEYTFSADMWINEYSKPFELFWLSDTKNDQKSGSSYVNVLPRGMRTIEPNKWTRVTWTFTTNPDDYTGYIRIDNNGTSVEGEEAVIRIANLKLEKGNRATDWTPAPEDLEDRVTTVETKIIQNDESITSLANRTTTVENKFAGYSTTEQMNSAISQSANSITSSVSQSYATKTELNSLEIGGRNLIAGTDEIREYVGNATGAAHNYKDVWTGRTIAVPTGTEYVVSFDAKADVAQNIQCFFYNPNTTTRTLSSTGYSSTSGDGVANVAITTEWARYWVKWTQTPPETIKSIIVGRTTGETDVYIRAVKLEEGNMPTDWTPAPEDMATLDNLESVQSSADMIEARVSTSETLIEQLTDSISMLVTDNNGESLMTQTANGWTFSTSQIQSIVDDTSENLDSLINEVGDVKSVVDSLRQAIADLGVLNEYVKIGTYEDEPCIELGETDSDFKLLITNTRILFMEGSGVPAYINNQSLYIKKAVIEEELHQGEFVWKMRANGNLGLIWKGVNS